MLVKENTILIYHIGCPNRRGASRAANRQQALPEDIWD
jgi:hypothetical protein